MTTFMEPVSRNMNSALNLLYPIAGMNSDQAARAVFFHPETGSAYTGFKRRTGGFGQVLMRAQYGTEAEVQATDKTGYYYRTPGFLHLEKPGEYYETDLGFPGPYLDNGERKYIDHKDVWNKIEQVSQQVQGHYEVGLNPAMIHDFLEHLKNRSNANLDNKKFNMQFNSPENVEPPFMVAQVADASRGILEITVQGQGRVITVEALWGPNSIVSRHELEDGDVYLVGIDRVQEGMRHVKVLRSFDVGVRVACQSFKMGVIKPGDPAYSVERNASGLMKDGILNMDFFEQQDPMRIKDAPMMVFDMDIMYHLFKTFKYYPSVTMRFLNDESEVYFKVFGDDEYLPSIEAIVGPTLKDVRGKIWLP